MRNSFFKNTLVSALLLSVIQAKAEFHQFTSNDGRTVSAEVTKYNRSQKKVELKREDGNIVRVQINLFIQKDQEYIVNWKKPPGGMVTIPAGTNSGTDPDFGAYALTLENTMYIDAKEITKEQWDEVRNWATSKSYSMNIGTSRGPSYPVGDVNWYDCVKWCNARSEKEGLIPCYTLDGSVFKSGEMPPNCNFEANGYRLPTGEEWDYAARGGLRSKRFPWGDTISHTQANYRGSDSPYDLSNGNHPLFDKLSSPAGYFSPNGYGLYDMVGNMWEWTNSLWADTGRRQGRDGFYRNTSDILRIGRGAVGGLNPTHKYPYCGFRAICLKH